MTFPAMLLLFVGSGFSALVYEVVWFHLLRLVIGASAPSLGVLLASFMGGLCLGSLLIPRMAGRDRNPLRVYALLELGIAVSGVALLTGLPWVQQLYLEAIGYGEASLRLRALACLVCLLPPTILMGGTLPIAARWVEDDPEGMRRLGFLYGANLVGAVSGTLAAGFWLLRLHDVAFATWVAVGVNLVVAVVALGLAASRSGDGAAGKDVGGKVAGTAGIEVAGSGETPGGDRDVRPYLVLCLSGFTALAAEVVWTRQLSLLLGATVYTFSILLAVFLAGLGVGSAVASSLVARLRRPAEALGWCQLALVVTIPLGAWTILQVLPWWTLDPVSAEDPWKRFAWDTLRAVVAMGPAALFWGASFPLGIAASADGRRDPGRRIGLLSAANTLGAIVGALGFSLVVAPGVGTQVAQQAMVAVAAVSAAILLVPARGPGALGRAAALAAGGARVVPPVPAGLIAYGRVVHQWATGAEFLYLAEGSSASVAVSRYPDGRLDFHVSGKVVASTDELDMRVQRMLGHLPALVHPRPRTVLVVGCGAGVTAGTFVRYPEVERIVLVEIEPRVMEGARDHFGPWNHDVLRDPRTVVVPDDARHYLATTRETFDIITSDPIHPWVKGSATLYSEEYLSLCRDRLNPGGVVTQWVPFYETSPEAVKSQIGTFLRVFPYGSVWNSATLDEGHDVVLLGHKGPRRIRVADLQGRIDADPELQASLEGVDLGTAVQLLGTYSGQGGDLDRWLADARLNTDLGLELQYLAGMALDTQIKDSIYDSMVAHRVYPDNLLEATAPEEAALRDLIEGP